MSGEIHKMAMGGRVMAVIFAVVLIVGAGIPIAQSTVDAANLSGITATIVGFVPVFLALGVLGVSAALI